MDAPATAPTDETSKKETNLENKATPELDAAILKQVEYYFSDVNLAHDKFLRNEIEKDEQGFVKLPVLTTFNKLKALSIDIQVISEVLRKSEFLVVNEEGTAVKTSRPIPPLKLRTKTKSDVQTIQIEGKTYSPSELKNTSQELFHKYTQGAEVNEEDRKILLGLLNFHPNAEGKKGGQAIEKIVKKKHPIYDRDCFFLVRADGTEEDFSLKKCTDMLSDEKKSNERPKGKRTQVNRAEEIAKNLHGCILQFKDVKEGLCLDDFKTYFAQFGFVRFVDFSRGETAGKIRFQEASHARDALQTPPPPEQFGETATFSLLEGEEEEAYITTIAEAQHSHRGKFRGKFKGKGKQGNRKNFTKHDD